MALSDPISLDIVIVGAGIAGLAAAISLRRAGHSVRIYERSALNNEVGAAIHVCPNASRVLLAFGLDPVGAQFVKAERTYRANGTTLVKFFESEQDYIEKKYGAPLFYAHRVDLHEELKRLATGQGIGKPATIHLSSEVTDYESTGSVRLADGTTIKADIVIAADGVHTRAAAALNVPRSSTATNDFAYRFLLSTEELMTNPETSELFQGNDGRFRIFAVSDGRRVVTYPCRDNKIQNFVCIFRDDKLALEETWHNYVDHRAIVKRFEDFHPSILAVLRTAKEARQWPLLYRPPMKTWHKDKLVVIGDAAHAMLPHQGQGGAQSIEDGLALGVALSNLQSADKETLEYRLRVFEMIRINRASVIQIFSNVGQEELERMRELAAEFIPADKVPSTPEGFYEYNYGYDVIKGSEELMLQKCPSWELPSSFVGL